ncbi:MAG: STAS-like domain-containing protein [Spirochaetes bacterium]|nr:STAS-like domain-containing protein [Spirochaetota bacterium]
MVIKVKKKAEEMKLKSPDLITRHMGREIYGAVSSLVGSMGDGETLVLDFEGVKVIDSSFVDEFIVRLILESRRLEPLFYVKLKNISEISEMNIDMVLRSHSKYKNKKIVVITENICQNNAFFIGPLSDREREFIEFIRVNRSLTTGDVARFTGCSRDDVEKMMEDCHSMRIVKKDDRGIYSAV